MPDFDVIVVGGGPAGAISALKCSELGLNVLLIEKGNTNRHKPCGGLLSPACVDAVSNALRINIPKDVISSPSTLELYYVYVSGGEKMVGKVENFRLLNVNRDMFDLWLRQLALKSGVKVLYESEFIGLKSRSNKLEASIKCRDKLMNMTTKYLIGCDGVYSCVRKKLYSQGKISLRLILQEYWRGKLDLADYFYVFFRSELTPAYSYILPKDGLYLIGIGAPRNSPFNILKHVNWFKKWLRKEFAFRLQHLIRRELWAIPHGFSLEGVGNAILAGDAAGFCNVFTGEGIRWAIESGVAAGKAVQDAICCNEPLASRYKIQVGHISRLVQKAQRLLIGLTDADLGHLVKFELTRRGQ
jgi:geranylgeranyl reductase family protein